MQHRWTMNPWFGSLLLSCPEGGAASWTERNVWTRGHGIESFPLRCPNATALAAFKAAVARGDINFYASAFCTMYEYSDASLLSWVSNFTHSVGTMGGQRHLSTVASQRDEPGVTRAAVPLLVDTEDASISLKEINARISYPRRYLRALLGPAILMLIGVVPSRA